jgi:hypothetical protein
VHEFTGQRPVAIAGGQMTEPATDSPFSGGVKEGGKESEKHHQDLSLGADHLGGNFEPRDDL